MVLRRVVLLHLAAHLIAVTAYSKATLSIESAYTNAELSISGVYKQAGSEVECFYLPLNDPIKNRSLPAITRILPKISEIAHAEKAFTKISSDTPFKSLYSYAGLPVYIKSEKNIPTKFNYKSFIRIDGQASVIVYDFYPVPLVNCPNESEARSPEYIPSIFSQPFTISSLVNRAEKFSAYSTTNGMVASIGLHLKAKSANHTANVSESAFQNKIKAILNKITTIYQTNFPDLKLPEQKIIHATEPTGHKVNDFLVINRKEGHVINKFQDDYLNWIYWAVTTEFIEASIVKNTNFDTDSIPVKLGMVEYLNIETLKRFDNRFNLINTYDQPLRFFRYSYLQALDNVAHRYTHRKVATLSSREAINYKASRIQLLLRYLAHKHSNKSVNQFLIDFIMQTKVVTMKGFTGHLKLKFKSSHKLIDFFLTSELWPDVKIENFFTQKSGQANQQLFIKGSSNLPEKSVIDIRVDGFDSKIVRSSFYTDKNGDFEKSILIDFDPKSVYLLDDRRAFDVNRYNNSSASTDFLFFPGSARTLYDDKYTVPWLMYPLKRPGEGLTIALVAKVYKYTHGNYSFEAEKDTLNGESYLSASHSRQLSHAGASVNFSFTKNRQSEILGSVSRSEASLRYNIFEIAPSLGLTLTAQSNQHDPVPSIFTSLNLSLDSTRIISSKYRARFDFSPYGEVSPQELNETYFTKRSVVTSLFIGHTSGFDLIVRGFRGFITGSSLIGDSKLFRINDLNTMKVRIDEDLDAHSTNSGSLNLDFNFPINFLFSGSKILAGKSSQGRIFKDFGTDYTTDTNYEAAGVGLVLPLGGKLFNTGNVIFSKLTLLAVLEEKINNDVNNDPKVLFGVNGQL